MKEKKYHLYYLLVLLLLATSNSIGQNIALPNAEKHLNRKLRIYEDPDIAIRIGDSIYNHKNSSKLEKVNALLLISDGYSSKREYQSALQYFSEALELSKQLNDKKLNITLYNRAGIKYQQLRLYDKALKNLDISLNLIQEYPNIDSVKTELAMNHIVKGFIYKDQLNCNIAIEYFDKGIEVLKKVGINQAASNISIATYNKGNCYISMNEYEDAKKSFYISIEHAEKVNANSLVAFSQKGLAEVATIEGRYQDAIDILNQALDNSKNVGDRILNRAIYRGLSINFLALNDFDQFEIYNTKFLHEQLEIKISERKSISVSLEDIKNMRTNHNEKYAKKFNIKLIFIIVLSLVFFSILIILLISSNKNITELKAQISSQRIDKK